MINVVYHRDVNFMPSIGSYLDLLTLKMANMVK